MHNATVISASHCLRASHETAELDPLVKLVDQEAAPLLLSSASPQRPLHQRAAKAASAASSLASTNPLLLSGSGQGMMTVVRTQFVPLGDSLSDSDSDSEVRRTQETDLAIELMSTLLYQYVYMCLCCSAYSLAAAFLSDVVSMCM